VFAILFFWRTKVELELVKEVLGDVRVAFRLLHVLVHTFCNLGQRLLLYLQYMRSLSSLLSAMWS
jgi:hypothetical protein